MTDLFITNASSDSLSSRIVSSAMGIWFSINSLSVCCSIKFENICLPGRFPFWNNFFTGRDQDWARNFYGETNASWTRLQPSLSQEKETLHQISILTPHITLLHPSYCRKGVTHSSYASFYYSLSATKKHLTEFHLSSLLHFPRLSNILMNKISNTR